MNDSFIKKKIIGIKNPLIKGFLEKKTNHMMLSSALTMMIDKTECLFSLNTTNSLSAKEIIEQTESPWIYHEIAMTKLVRKKKLEEFRKGSTIKSLELSEAEKFVIKYDVSLEHLEDLTQIDLSKWLLLKRRSK